MDLNRYSPATLAEPLEFEFCRTTGIVNPGRVWGYLPYKGNAPIPKHHALGGDQFAHDIFDHRFPDDDGSPGWELASLGVEHAYQMPLVAASQGKLVVNDTLWLDYLMAILCDDVVYKRLGESFLEGGANTLLLGFDTVREFELPPPPSPVEWTDPPLGGIAGRLGARSVLARRAWEWVLFGRMVGKRYYDGTPPLAIHTLRRCAAAFASTLAYGSYEQFFPTPAENADPPKGWLREGARIVVQVLLGEATPLVLIEIDRAPDDPLVITMSWRNSDETLYVVGVPNDHPVFMHWHFLVNAKLVGVAKVVDHLGQVAPFDLEGRATTIMAPSPMSYFQGRPFEVA